MQTKLRLAMEDTTPAGFQKLRDNIASTGEAAEGLATEAREVNREMQSPAVAAHAEDVGRLKLQYAAGGLAAGLLIQKMRELSRVQAEHTDALREQAAAGRASGSAHVEAQTSMQNFSAATKTAAEATLTVVGTLKAAKTAFTVFRVGVAGAQALTTAATATGVALAGISAAVAPIGAVVSAVYLGVRAFDALDKGGSKAIQDIKKEAREAAKEMRKWWEDETTESAKWIKAIGDSPGTIKDAIGKIDAEKLIGRENMDKNRRALKMLSDQADETYFGLKHLWNMKPGDEDVTSIHGGDFDKKRIAPAGEEERRKALLRTKIAMGEVKDQHAEDVIQQVAKEREPVREAEDAARVGQVKRQLFDELKSVQDAEDKRRHLAAIAEMKDINDVNKAIEEKTEKYRGMTGRLDAEGAAEELRDIKALNEQKLKLEEKYKTDQKAAADEWDRFIKERKQREADREKEIIKTKIDSENELEKRQMEESIAVQKKHAEEVKAIQKQLSDDILTILKQQQSDKEEAKKHHGSFKDKPFGNPKFPTPQGMAPFTGSTVQGWHQHLAGQGFDMSQLPQLQQAAAQANQGPQLSEQEANTANRKRLAERRQVAKDLGKGLKGKNAWGRDHAIDEEIKARKAKKEQDDDDQRVLQDLKAQQEKEAQTKAREAQLQAKLQAKQDADAARQAAAAAKAKAKQKASPPPFSPDDDDAERLRNKAPRQQPGSAGVGPQAQAGQQAVQATKQGLDMQQAQTDVQKQVGQELNQLWGQMNGLRQQLQSLMSDSRTRAQRGNVA